MLGKKEVPAGQGACTGGRQPKNAAWSSSARGWGCSFPVGGQSLRPLAPGTGKKLASAFWGMLCFCWGGAALALISRGRGEGAHAAFAPRKSPRREFSEGFALGAAGLGAGGSGGCPPGCPTVANLAVPFQQLLFDSVCFVQSRAADGQAEELLLVRIPVKN